MSLHSEGDKRMTKPEEGIKHTIEEEGKDWHLSVRGEGGRYMEMSGEGGRHLAMEEWGSRRMAIRREVERQLVLQGE